MLHSCRSEAYIFTRLCSFLQFCQHCFIVAWTLNLEWMSNFLIWLQEFLWGWLGSRIRSFISSRECQKIKCKLPFRKIYQLHCMLKTKLIESDFVLYYVVRTQFWSSVITYFLLSCSQLFLFVYLFILFFSDTKPFQTFLFTINIFAAGLAVCVKDHARKTCIKYNLPLEVIAIQTFWNCYRV